MKKAVFLDKDGTLIINVPYNVNPTLVQLVPDAGAALQTLKSMGFELVVISNQAGIAKGYFSVDDIRIVFAKINELLQEYDVSISAFFFCPHLKSGTVERYSRDCHCRKPLPGLIMDAADQLEIDLSLSWMIGDILDDVEAGNRAGCRTVLINNGNETEWVMVENRVPGFIVSHLATAAEVISKNSIQ